MRQPHAGMGQQVTSVGWRAGLCGEMRRHSLPWATWNHTEQEHHIWQVCVPWCAQHGSKKFLHRAPWQRSFPQRNMQWQGKQFWSRILSTPVVCLCMPSQTCSAWSAKFCYRWFNYTLSISWKYMDTQDCYRAITTEDNQCHKGNSWYRSIYENIVA